jgi:hypothetical protein
MQCRLVPFLCFVGLLVLYRLFSFLFPGSTNQEHISGIHQSYKVSSDVSAIWKNRHPEYELKCDPKNDYFSQLEGHNWNKWMAKTHSIAESYERQNSARPRVPCNNYWHTGKQSCVASYGSKAYGNHSFKAQCDIILDNGYERGRAIPIDHSRAEGWPHLGSSALANKEYSLPLLSSSNGNIDRSGKRSQWNIGYPLQGDGKVKELSTLDLLSIIEAKGNAMNNFAVNLGANDGATSVDYLI